MRTTTESTATSSSRHERRCAKFAARPAGFPAQSPQGRPRGFAPVEEPAPEHVFRYRENFRRCPEAVVWKALQAEERLSVHGLPPAASDQMHRHPHDRCRVGSLQRDPRSLTAHSCSWDARNPCQRGIAGPGGFMAMRFAAGRRCTTLRYHPLHLNILYGQTARRLPHGEKLDEAALSLPLHPRLSDADIGRIIGVIHRYYSGQ